jgi:hypothetical protein
MLELSLGEIILFSIIALFYLFNFLSLCWQSNHFYDLLAQYRAETKSNPEIKKNISRKGG